MTRRVRVVCESIFLSSTALLLLLLPVAAAAQSAQTTHRAAIVVGANAAAPGRRPLRYAHEDAREVASVLLSVGGFDADDVHVLLDPTPEAVLEAVDRELRAMSRMSDETMLVFYYSGHADERSLYPGGRRLDFDALRSRLDDDAASIRIGVIDTCRGGGWTGTRGLSEAEAFEVNVPLDLTGEGSVLIASSSGLEDAHESEVLERGFFTHHWNAGLRGAADQNADQTVTLTEAFDYAKRLTIRDTALRTEAPQHPSYRMNLRGRRDLPLSRLSGGTSVIELEQATGPTQLVHLDSGLIVLETPPGRRSLRLAVPPGQYLVRTRAGTQTRAAEVSVRAGRATHVGDADLQAVTTDASATRSFVPRPVTLTTLPAGMWDIRLAVGVRHGSPAPGVSLAGSSESNAAVLVQANVGITDRLQWVVPSVALAYRLGDSDGLELIPWGGLTSWGAGYSSIEETILTGSVGLGLDLRYWLSARSSIQAGMAFSSAFRWSSANEVDGDYAPTTWRLGLSAGYTHTLGDVLTLTLAARYSQSLIHEGDAPSGRDEWRARLGLGSVQDLALRTLPLIKVHLGDVVSLDGHAAIEYDFASERFEETYMLGATFVF